MGDKQTDSKTTVSFPNVKVSSINDDGEAEIKYAFKVDVLCEYDPEVSFNKEVLTYEFLVAYNGEFSMRKFGMPPLFRNPAD